MQSFRSYLLLLVASVIIVPLAHSQTISRLNAVHVLANVPGKIHFVKLRDVFTAPDHVSYFMGSDSGGFIYDPKDGKMTQIASGDFYERARSYVFPGDSTASIIASNGNLAVFRAKGDGQWSRQDLSKSVAHDLLLNDIDGDGKMDVVSSGTSLRGSDTAEIVFQNEDGSWFPMFLASPAGDGIATFQWNHQVQIVVCSGNSLVWYENPGGRSARILNNWRTHVVSATCNAGTSLRAIDLADRPILIVASNESNSGGDWLDGLAYYDPGPNIYAPWEEHILDSSYRDVHEIAVGVSNGVPFFVAGEQEQASRICNRTNYNDHAKVSGCRVEVWSWNGNGFKDTANLSNFGTQNQTLSIDADGAIVHMVGANHNFFGASDPSLNEWDFELK
jgi:hypothetical protein